MQRCLASEAISRLLKSIIPKEIGCTTFFSTLRIAKALKTESVLFHDNLSCRSNLRAKIGTHKQEDTMVLTAVQQGKYSVRIITDKSMYYTTGIRQGYTDTNVSVKNNEKPTAIRICNEKGATVRVVNSLR